MGAKDIKELKKHKFFAGVDWDKIMEIEPPFKPEGKEFDASYFPKAMEKDEEIQAIMNDPKMEMKKDAN